MGIATHHGSIQRQSAVICDLDGTLVDVRSVRQFVEGTQSRDFDAFHAASIDCPRHDQVFHLLAKHRDAGALIVIVTAREARWSFLTTLWLRENGVDYDELLMREARDNRPDHVVKDGFARRLEAKYRIELAVDDREDILEVWHRHGFPTVKVEPDGNLSTSASA